MTLADLVSKLEQADRERDRLDSEMHAVNRLLGLWQEELDRPGGHWPAEATLLRTAESLARDMLGSLQAEDVALAGSQKDAVSDYLTEHPEHEGIMLLLGQGRTLTMNGRRFVFGTI